MGHRALNRVDSFTCSLDHTVACRDDIGVVTRAAGKYIVAAVAGQDIVDAIAGAIDRAKIEPLQCFIEERKTA